MTRKLVRLCEHDELRAHAFTASDDEPIPTSDCPGGEFLPEDALVIEKIDGEWNISALAAMEMELDGNEDEIVEVCERMLDALAADQVGEPG